MEQIVLADQRRLAYAVVGAPQGQPLVALHGTPGSARQLACLDRQARERNIAVITPDRAGYGGSSNDPQRTIGSSARDVGELIKHLGLKPCPVIGLSGGGPSALACGVVIPQMVSTITTVGGVAPLVPRDRRIPPDRLVMKVARRSELATRLLFAAIVRSGRTKPERALDRFAAIVAEPDQRLIREDAEVRAAFLDDLSHPAKTTARATARDFWLFAHLWDINVGAMAVPAHIWHGTADRNVPVAHATIIVDRCPKAELHIIEGGGHLLIDQIDEILTTAMTASPSATQLSQDSRTGPG